MAIRNFDLVNNTIFIQFQYAKDAITASTRTYSKPPKADYGCETVFNPNDTKAYNVRQLLHFILVLLNCVAPFKCHPSDVGITQLDQYLLLLEVLAAEETGRDAFIAACKLIDTLLETRKSQMAHPRLMFNLFDPLRNSAARNSRIAKVYKVFKI